MLQRRTDDVGLVSEDTSMAVYNVTALANQIHVAIFVVELSNEILNILLLMRQRLSATLTWVNVNTAFRTDPDRLKLFRL